MSITSVATDISFPPAKCRVFFTVKNFFRDIMQNVEENEILHEIFHVVPRFPHYISSYISENLISLGQCMTLCHHIGPVDDGGDETGSTPLMKSPDKKAHSAGGDRTTQQHHLSFSAP